VTGIESVTPLLAKQVLSRLSYTFHLARVGPDQVCEAECFHVVLDGLFLSRVKGCIKALLAILSTLLLAVGFPNRELQQCI
jgi:hypothetical protein